MLDQLLNIAGSWEEPTELILELEALTWRERDLHLVVRSGRGLPDIGTWRIRAVELRGLNVTERNGELRLLAGEHPVVRQFTDPIVDLTFYGRPEDPERLAGALLRAHRACAGNWLAAETYANPHIEQQDLLAAGFGAIAEGPLFLLQEYHGVLVAAGLKATLGSPRHEWREDVVCEVDGPSWGLSIGNSWFVARELREERVDTSSG